MPCFSKKIDKEKAATVSASRAKELEDRLSHQPLLIDDYREKMQDARCK